MIAELQARGADELMIVTVSQTIEDLREERVMPGEYERYVSTRIRSLLDRKMRSLSASRSSDNIHSNSMDIDNLNT